LNSRSLGPQPSALDQTKPQPVKGQSYSAVLNWLAGVSHATPRDS
jgi:hypothetical protein